jgi:hypothetical protein
MTLTLCNYLPRVRHYTGHGGSPSMKKPGLNYGNLGFPVVKVGNSSGRVAYWVEEYPPTLPVRPLRAPSSNNQIHIHREPIIIKCGLYPMSGCNAVG